MRPSFSTAASIVESAPWRTSPRSGARADPRPISPARRPCATRGTSAPRTETPPASRRSFRPNRAAPCAADDFAGTFSAIAMTGVQRERPHEIRRDVIAFVASKILGDHHAAFDRRTRIARIVRDELHAMRCFFERGFRARRTGNAGR